MGHDGTPGVLSKTLPRPRRLNLYGQNKCRTKFPGLGLSTDLETLDNHLLYMGWSGTLETSTETCLPRILVQSSLLRKIPDDHLWKERTNPIDSPFAPPTTSPSLSPFLPLFLPLYFYVAPKFTNKMPNERNTGTRFKN